MLTLTVAFSVLRCSHAKRIRILKVMWIIPVGNKNWHPYFLGDVLTLRREKINY